MSSSSFPSDYLTIMPMLSTEQSRAAQEAFVQGWQQAMWAGFTVMVVLLAFVVLRGPAEPVPAASVLSEI